MSVYLLEVNQNAEGSKLAYLSPMDEAGEIEGGYRIAGPKAWGGSRSLARLKISSSDLVEFVMCYAPDVRDEIVRRAVLAAAKEVNG